MKKIFCAMCGNEFKGGVIGEDIAFPVVTEDPDTGEREDGMICLKCTAIANKETGGQFLGVNSLEEIDFSHYLADCDDEDCEIEHEKESN